MTLVSLLITLVVSAAARMDRALPPPHSALLAASAINAKLCCSEETGEEGKGDQSATNYAKDWRQLFALVNNMLSLLLLVIYVLGVIILCS